MLNDLIREINLKRIEFTKRLYYKSCEIALLLAKF